MTKGVVLTVLSVFVGFAVGYGVGQGTRKNTAGNVDASYYGGKVTIVANVAGALQDGVSEFISGL